MFEDDITDIKQRMNKALESMKNDFLGLRTGRASVSMLDSIQVDAYGSKIPLNQAATINAPEPKLITVQVWDKSMVDAVEASIRESDLGLNPMKDGQLIRLPIPDLSEERRQEIAKVAKKFAENAKIAVRNIRRDSLDKVKKQQSGGDVSEDQFRYFSDEVQKITDSHTKDIDELLIQKEKDIMQV
jgi:ribosome recycling factor